MSQTDEEEICDSRNEFENDGEEDEKDKREDSDPENSNIDGVNAGVKRMVDGGGPGNAGA
jgi:hypothetical protein